MKRKFNRYEYPIKDKHNKTYNGSYTIREGVQPLGFPNEQLVQTFEAEVK